MKKLNDPLKRAEMKKVVGGTNKFWWSCFSASDGGIVQTCSATDPTAHCSGCGYSGCTNTGVSCGANTLCVC